jgi:hypothetical protein
MRKMLSVISSLVLLLVCLSSQAFGFGEDVLAASGQYTFFIKPCPGSDVTYYQKMVPCVLTEEVPVPRPVAPVFPVPVPTVRNQPVTRTETPVGCAQGVSPCIECRPMPSTAPGSGEVVLPPAAPFRVPGFEPAFQTVKRRIMLPQWFAVTEEPRQVRKVAPRPPVVGPRG